MGISVVALIGITAFIYAMIIIFGHLSGQTHNLSTLRTYLLFLLFPQISFFAVFSIIYYQIFGYLHKIYLENIDMERTEYYIKWSLIVANLILVLFLIIFIWILAFAPSAIHALTIIWCLYVVFFVCSRLRIVEFIFIFM